MFHNSPVTTSISVFPGCFICLCSHSLVLPKFALRAKRNQVICDDGLTSQQLSDHRGKKIIYFQLQAEKFQRRTRIGHTWITCLSWTNPWGQGDKVQLGTCVNPCIQRKLVYHRKKAGVLGSTRNRKEFQCSNSFIYVILTPVPTPPINCVKS